MITDIVSIATHDLRANTNCHQDFFFCRGLDFGLPAIFCSHRNFAARIPVVRTAIVTGLFWVQILIQMA